MSAVSVMGEILAGLFSPSGVTAFALGIASVWMWHRIKAWHTNGHTHRTRFNAFWIGWALITVAIVFVGVKAQESWDCNRQFGDALRARSALSIENERLATIERDAQQQWLLTLINPPPDVKHLSGDDPRRQAWGLAVTQTYLDTVASARKQRAANDAERARHPLPEPTCGK